MGSEIEGLEGSNRQNQNGGDGC